MKKKRKRQPRQSFRKTQTGRWVTVSKAIDPEHPDLYGTNVDIAYKLSVDQFRSLFNLDDGWRLTSITVDGYMPAGGVRGASIVFSRNAGGPKKAMEILAGDKPSPEEASF